MIYDPFMGTGTTAVACKEMGMNYIGSEISENQVRWAENRLSKIYHQPSLFSTEEDTIKAYDEYMSI